MKIQAGPFSRALRTVSVSATGPQVSDKPSVLLIAKGDRLVCRSTDLGVFTETVFRVKQGTEKPISVLCALGPIDTFVSNQAEDALIDLQIEKAEVRISSQRDRAKVKTLEKSSFLAWPAMPEFAGLETIDGAELIRAMKDVVFSASSTLVTPELYCVHVVIDGGRIIVEAADGRRYCSIIWAIKKVKAQVDKLLPLRAVQTLTQAEKAKVGATENFLCFRTVESGLQTTMWCRTATGKYPDVQGSMLPTKFSTVMALEADELVRALRVCVAYADDVERDIGLTLEPTGLKLAARDSSAGAYTSRVKPVKSKGNGHILLDVKHLLDFAGSVKGKLVLKMNGPKEVCVVEDTARSEISYVMWPLTRAEPEEEGKASE